MKVELGNYCGEVLKRERVNDIKCYFVQSDNPAFRYAEDRLDRNKEMKARADAIMLDIISPPGFALVWKPDVIVGAVKDDLRGFSVLRYDFVKDSSIEDPRPVAISAAEPIKDLCQLNAEIIGEESKILRNSKSKEEYLSKWCLQSRFEQHYSFKL